MINELEFLKEMEREAERLTPENIEEKRADFIMAIRHIINALENDYLKITRL